jgi:hypothetical protein
MEDKLIIKFVARWKIQDDDKLHEHLVAKFEYNDSIFDNKDVEKILDKLKPIVDNMWQDGECDIEIEYKINRSMY